MKLKLVIVLATAFGFPAMLASATAQQFGGTASAPTAPPPPPAVTPGGHGGYIISDAKIEAVPVPVPPLPPAPPGAATLYAPGQRDWKASYYTMAIAPMNAEEANLAREAEELGRKLGDAKGDADRSKVRTQLSEVLGRQFDLRQKRHQDEIKALEDKVKKLRDLVDKRQENRRDIIAKRLDQIQSDAEGLGW
jgi:hypothetical protein